MPSSFLPWHMGTFVVVEVVSPRFSFFFLLHPRPPPPPRASCETIESFCNLLLLKLLLNFFEFSKSENLLLNSMV